MHPNRRVRRRSGPGRWLPTALAYGSIVSIAVSSLLPAPGRAADVGSPGSSAAANAPTAAPLPPVEDFFRLPALTKPALSPDGHYLAGAVGGKDGRLQLAVLNMQALDKSLIVAHFDDADVYNYHWVNSERLVFSVVDTQQADRPLAPGLWAVNRDGSDDRALIEASGHRFISNGSSHIVDRRLPWQWHLNRTVRDGSADVIVEAATYDGAGQPTGSRLVRLDTRTGLTTSLIAGAPDHVMDWFVDLQGVPAFAMARYKGHYTTYRRAPDGWKVWEETDDVGGPKKRPVAVYPDGRLLVKARGPRGETALFAASPATAALDPEPIVSTPGYDFNGSLVDDAKTHRLLGVHYETDAAGTVWLDGGMRALQAQIDKLLPATINRIDCEQCTEVPAVLVTAQSDRQPPVFYLFDRQTSHLTLISASMPWIKPAQMGSRDLLRFKARDGLSIPVWVTQPPGPSNQPRPAVVMVHGGPFVRGGHWPWERNAQFLASRGYVVIEPEFRGSTGFGFAHFKAGWKQWGLAMQDDVTDATRWAIQQKLADPKRICIAGASYGGYATLMGLIKEPDLYRCGFEWVGVTDISLIYSISWSDTSDEYKRYGMPALVGDPEQDAAQFKATSPVEQASRLRAPLLMAYGGEDVRVPLKHGTEFRDAVSRTNPNVEWIFYPSEGHGWRELKDNVDFWSRVEKFLDRHIGEHAAASAP